MVEAGIDRRETVASLGPEKPPHTHDHHHRPPATRARSHAVSNTLPPPLFQQIERIRTVAQCASSLARAGDDDAAHALAQKMTDELTAMPVEEAMPLTRACG
jgi:hypothetical protein